MGLFDFMKGALSGGPSENNSVFDSIVAATLGESKKEGREWYIINLLKYKSYTELLLPLPDKQKIAFILDAVPAICESYHGQGAQPGEKLWYRATIAETFMRQLLKTKLHIDEDDFSAMAESFIQHKRYTHGVINQWPFGLLVNQAEKQWKQKELPEKVKQALQGLQAKLEEQKDKVHEKEQTKIREKIATLLFRSPDNVNAVKPTFFPCEDPFATFANGQIQQMPEAGRNHWFRLMLLSQKASGGKPSKKYLEEAKALFKELGADTFKKTIHGWIEFIIHMKQKEPSENFVNNGRFYTNTPDEFIATPNMEMIKGFTWMCVHFHDKTTLFMIAALAERAYRKIPGIGPTAVGIGNAALYVLANTKGLDGIGHLSRLKLRIKQNSTQNIIDKYLAEAAAAQGVSVHEVEDMAMDDHDLVNGRREYAFDDFKAILEVTGIGKTELRWFRPDGSPQKSAPAAIKDKHAAKLKKVKDTAKQVELTLTAQRDRLDRLFKSDRTLSAAQFREYYLEHGLMSFIARKMIWNIEQDGAKQAVFLKDSSWVTSQGHPVLTDIKEDALISLWHPALATVDEVRAWREFMMENRITQPLKQAFREVYLLTDAEINTRTYSNRMAAHILKQHQFNSLAKARGWKYALLGAFDNGGNEQKATILLPDYQLRAEFWINEVNAENAHTDTGIWSYVATDQVRFVHTQRIETMELISIPPIVLSEIMRDVDLFVGVASVGNDPAWRDTGGIPAYRDYWQSYSFGELTEVAKTRKAILERLIPRLKIAPVAEIKDKFLIIKGTLRTYKIHLGSTNILMEPNDQYLCIVPDRNAQPQTENLFIPFEGDNGLSIILSKAFLLAADDTIKDTTITRQIKNR